MHPLRFKVCCIQDESEAELAIRYGAAAIGLVSEMPSGPGPIPEDCIRRIARVIPPPVATFLLTCLQDVEAIVAQQRRCCTNTIQLCDRLRQGDHARLRDQLAGISIVQVIHVAGAESISEAVAIAPYVDAILLDSGNQTLPVKELGGTGRVHDWTISRQICDSVKIPVFLAGGFRPDNVRTAIEQVRPFGLDVCSGLRTNGRLDPLKLDVFVKEVGRAGQM